MEKPERKRQVLPPELESFLTGTQDPRTFRHADHVRVAFEMLRRHSFLFTARVYSQRLKRMTASVGKPQAYNETITIAFLSVIAEHMAKKNYAAFEAFAADHPEVLEKSLLSQWYEPEQLRSEVARQTFVLPRAALKPL